MKKQMMARTLLIASSSILMMSYQNCSKMAFQSVSSTEASKLGGEVFDANNKVAGIEGADGQPSENLRVTSALDAATHFVKDCSLPVTLNDGTTVSRFEYERSQAIKRAIDDPDKKTIPVEFAVSFGQLEDRLASWAHKRAILSEGDTSNVSYIPVGQRGNTSYVEGNASFNAYYKVDHAAAREHYVNGETCFFDTVKIKGDLVKSGDYYDFLAAAEKDQTQLHMAHYMYYGWCVSDCATDASVYGAGNYGKDSYPNRLFGAWPHQEAGAPQIVKLYVADLRDGQFGLSTATNKIVRNGEGSARGTELQMDVKKDLDLKTIFRNRDAAIWNLSNAYVSPTTKQSFAGMRGVPQLISNLSLAGASGTVLASQYTPIVVDLGAERVKTSGVFAGSFFNMADKSTTTAGVTNSDFTQQTAWLSGDLVDHRSRMPASTDANIVANFSRTVEDGFLVMADENGKVSSSRQMLGDKTVVKDRTYSNGFEALQALAHKDCTSAEIKDRYFGPWDGTLYSSKIKVWIDANRNGAVDTGELKSLQQAGVVALNACNIVHNEAQDAFGNGTSLRSAFLYNDDPSSTLTESEILHRLDTGKTTANQEASFRLAIDLIFKVNESMTLE